MELDQFSRDMRCAPQHIREWFCAFVGWLRHVGLMLTNGLHRTLGLDWHRQRLPDGNWEAWHDFENPLWKTVKRTAIATCVVLFSFAGREMR